MKPDIKAKAEELEFIKHLKLRSIHQTAKLCGVKDEVIAGAVERGEIKIWTYFTRTNPKIPMYALDEWIENNSHYKQQERKVI
jgi:hypothetical protein